MKKTLTILIVLLMGVSAIYSQKEPYNWCFGNHCMITFNTTPPVFLNSSEMTAWEGCAAISDNKGKLIFYTNGINIWGVKNNGEHYLLDNAGGKVNSNLNGHNSSTQVGVIIPKPGQKYLNYVFTTDAEGGGNGLKYTIVDTRPNTSTGKFDIAKDINNNYLKNQLINKSSTEKITACLHKDGKSYWIIMHEWNNSTFCAYRLDSQGIDIANSVKKSIGSVHSYRIPTDPRDTVTQIESHGYMKVSPDGSIIALTILRTGKVELFRFDNATGEIKHFFPGDIDFSLNEQRFYNAYGIEFSANSKMLYVSTIDEKPSKIYQINLEKIQKPEDITSNIRLIDSLVLLGEHFAALQLGPDTKIYVSIDDGEYISVINNPEVEGIGCNFKQNGIFIPFPAVPMKGLPTFIQSFFKPPSGITVSNDSPCEGDTIYFEAQYVDGAIYTWKSPDGKVFSNEYNPDIKDIKLNGTGKYKVTIQLGTQVTEDEVDIKVFPSPAVTIDNPGDTIFICQGQKASITSSPKMYDILYWSNGDSTPTIEVDSTGMYTIYVGTNNDCWKTDSIYVMVEDTIEAVITSSTGEFKACDGEEITLTADNLNRTDVTFNWYREDNPTVSLGTAQSLIVNKTGKYIVTISDSRNLCPKTYSVNIEIGRLNPTIDGETIMCNNLPVFLAVTKDPNDSEYTSYTWSKGQTTSFIEVNQPDTIWVQVTDNLGCIGRDTIIIKNVDVKAIFNNLDDVDLGRIYYNQSSGDIIRTVTNNSGVDLKIKSVTLSDGTDIVVTPATASTFVNGASIDFKFNFNPKSIKEYETKVIVEIEEPCSLTFEGRVEGYGIADLLVYVPPVSSGKIGNKAFELPVMAKLNIKDDSTATASFSQIVVNFDAAAYNPTSVKEPGITMSKFFDKDNYMLEVTLKPPNPYIFTKDPQKVATLSGQLGFGKEGSPIMLSPTLNSLLLNLIIQNGTFSFYGACQPDLLKVTRNNATFAKIAPNPSNGEIEVTVTNTQAGEHEISFVNSIGSRLLTTTLTKSADNYSEGFRLDVSSLPAGVYMMVIKTATEVLTENLVIVK